LINFQKNQKYQKNNEKPKKCIDREKNFGGRKNFGEKKKENPKSLIFYTHERRLTLAKKPEATANLSHFPQTLPSLGGISPSSTSHQPKFFLLSAKIPPSSKHTRQPLT
jgi:hypothetical protein